MSKYMRLNEKTNKCKVTMSESNVPRNHEIHSNFDIFIWLYSHLVDTHGITDDKFII